MSDLYQILARTCTSFIQSTAPSSLDTNRIDADAILRLCASDFEISWGHAYFVSTQPHLQGSHSAEGFIQHLGRMTPLLHTWKIVITDMSVDTVKKTVVARVEFTMFAHGDEAGVLNEIVFWMGLSDDGTEVKRAVEFVDGVATAELGKRMKR